MRRAAWRALPQDPRSPLAWWARGARRFLVPPGLVVGAFLLGLALHAPTVAFGGFAVAALVAARALALREEEERALGRLAPLPGPVETFLVAFEISYRGVATGRDQGVASFVEGWLHVEGLRTGFSLRPIDAARAERTPDGMETFDLAGGQRVGLRALGSSADRATFGETVRVWHLFTVGEIRGEPLLPPLRVHPSAVRRPLTTLVLAAPVVLALLMWLWGASTIQESLAWSTPILTFAYFGLRPVGKAIRDLRSLNAIDRLGREAEEKETPPERRLA